MNRASDGRFADVMCRSYHGSSGDGATYDAGSGCALKNCHMSVSAFTAFDCGPSTSVYLGGSVGPPGHSWPSPTIVYNMTSAPPLQPLYAVSSAPVAGSVCTGVGADP